MEKLVYVLWSRADLGRERLRDAVLGLSEELSRRGAQGLSFNLCDEQAAFAQGMRITRMDPPIAGTASVWMHTALDRAPIEESLRGVAERLAGYLVLESMPLVNRTHVVPAGERLPGICTVALLEKPDFLSYEGWLEKWQGHHTRVAIETQSTFFYIQNVIVRAVTPDAPPWAAIVEEGFPAEAATDPMVFYAAGHDPEKLKANQRRMFASCREFIDFTRIESHPMSRYEMGGGIPGSNAAVGSKPHG